LQSSRLKPLSPQSNGFAVHAILGGDHNLGFARGDGQNDTAAERHLLWRAQGRQPAFELLLLILRQDEWLGEAGHN